MQVQKYWVKGAFAKDQTHLDSTMTQAQGIKKDKEHLRSIASKRQEATARTTDLCILCDPKSSFQHH